MTTWVLILILMGPSGATTMIEVDGYSSAQNCQTAATIWQRQKQSNGSIQATRAVCLPKK